MKERPAAEAAPNFRRHLGQGDIAICIFRRLQSTPLLAELCSRIVDGAKRAAQFLVQIGRVPSLRIDRLDVLQMLRKTFVRHA